MKVSKPKPLVELLKTELAQAGKINHYSFTSDLERITQRVNDDFDTIPNLASAEDIEQWLNQQG